MSALAIGLADMRYKDMLKVRENISGNYMRATLIALKKEETR